MIVLMCCHNAKIKFKYISLIAIIPDLRREHEELRQDSSITSANTRYGRIQKVLSIHTVITDRSQITLTEQVWFGSKYPQFFQNEGNCRVMRHNHWGRSCLYSLIQAYSSSSLTEISGRPRLASLVFPLSDKLKYPD